MDEVKQNYYGSLCSDMYESVFGNFRACLETHLSIMKRFSSMLAMAI